MRNLAGFAPKQKSEKETVMNTNAGTEGLFRPDPLAAQLEDPWVQTSLRMRLRTRAQAKAFAATHGMPMQELLDLALKEYMEG